MSEKTRFFKNIGFSLIGNFANQALMVIYFIIASRYLVESEMGVYSFAISTVGFLLAFIDFGISTAAVREIARDRSVSRTLMPRAVGIKTAAGFACMLLVWAASYHASPTAEAASALRLMAPLLLLSCLFAPYCIVFQATERLEFFAAAQLFHRVMMLAAILLAVYLDKHVSGVIVSQLFGVACLNLLVVYIMHRYYHPVGISFDPAGWKSLLAKSVPFMAMSLIWEIYNRIDQILIPYLDGMEANGLYAVAYRYAFVSIGVAQAVNAVVYPHFSRRAAESGDAVRAGTIELYRYMGVMGFGIAAFTAVPAVEWIVLLSGARYARAAGALVVLSCSVPFMFLNSINVSLLYAHYRHKQVLIFSIISVSANVVLDLLLIPVMGYIGAAWATLACVIAIFLQTFIACGKFVPLKTLAAKTIGPLVSSALAGLVLFLLRDTFLPLRLAAGAAAFAVLLFVTRGVVLKDFDVVSQALAEYSSRKTGSRE